MRATLDETSCPTVQSEDLRRWLLLEDSVLWHQASAVMGPTNLQLLAEEYKAQGSLFEAAKVGKLASSSWTFTADVQVIFARADGESSGSGDSQNIVALMKQAVDLLQEGDALSTLKGQQLGRSEGYECVGKGMKSNTLAL